MGKYSGLPKTQATSPGSSWLNQGLFHNPEALKSPKAVQAWPVCPQSQEQPQAFGHAQILTRRRQYKQPSEPNALSRCFAQVS